jgi:Cu+-exporting ATPase
LLARIIAGVSEAQRSKAPIQKLADKVSAYLVPCVILIALITFVIWAWMGPQPRFAYALINAIAVLIIACPCALGLATPMSIRVGVGKGAEMGVLIKNAETLEKLGKLKTLLIDKTGTLTEGKPKLTQMVTSSEGQELTLLTMAAAVEKKSEHPLGVAIVNEAHDRNIDIPDVKEFESITGNGATGQIEGRHVLIGNAKLMLERNVEGLLALQAQAEEAQVHAQTVIYVAADGIALGFISVSDPLKVSSKQAMKDLHHLGIKVIMLTGDNEKTAKAVAKELNIDEIRAGIGPTDKIDWVQKYQCNGRLVAMAGDGINDSPALAAADVGIAMGTGTDAAIESAAVTLVKGDLQGIERAIALSRATMTNIRQNLFFAIVYNAACIPLAAGILYPFTGLLINPMIASVAMALSSVTVILNSLRIKYIPGYTEANRKAKL